MLRTLIGAGHFRQFSFDSNAPRASGVLFPWISRQILFSFRRPPLLFLRRPAVSVRLVASPSSSDTSTTSSSASGNPSRASPISHCTRSTVFRSRATLPQSSAYAWVRTITPRRGRLGERRRKRADYGPPKRLYNSEATNDDCKYHEVELGGRRRERRTVNFTVDRYLQNDGCAGDGQFSRFAAEVFLDEKTPGPNTNRSPSETSPHVYGSARFLSASPGLDVRFTSTECDDGENSPHGHARRFSRPVFR